MVHGVSVEYLVFKLDIACFRMSYTHANLLVHSEHCPPVSRTWPNLSWKPEPLYASASILISGSSSRTHPSRDMIKEGKTDTCFGSHHPHTKRTGQRTGREPLAHLPAPHETQTPRPEPKIRSIYSPPPLPEKKIIIILTMLLENFKLDNLYKKPKCHRASKALSIS
jgi:hypothetical protein